MKALASVPGHLIPVLTAHPLFSGLPALVRAAFVRDCEACELAAGEALMHQYDEGHGSFILLDGRLRAEVVGSERTDQREVLGHIEPGALVGEMGAVSGESRSASVYAETPCVLLEIPRHVLQSVLADAGPAARHLAVLLGRRIAHADRALYDLAHGRAPAPEKGAGGVRRMLGRVFERFVRSRLHDPVFLVLVWFLGVLLLNRLAFEFWLQLRQSGALLRAFYLSGLALFVGCSLTLLFAYRRRLVRWAARGIGAGLGLVVNKLSLLIAFDIFYADMTTLDPARPFSYAELYERSEWIYVALILLCVLLMLVYFRGLWRIAWYALRARRTVPLSPSSTQENEP